MSGNSVGYHTTGGETTLDVVTGEGRDSPYTCAAYEHGRGHVGGKLYVVRERWNCAFRSS